MRQNKGKIIGLTGGIASGKSTVSNLLKSRQIPIIDCDVISRQIVEVGSPVLKELALEFGKDIICQDGSLDRKKLGAKVFGNESALKILNNIMHKRVEEKILLDIDKLKINNQLIVVDIPLLIEANMMHLVDEIWLVVVDEQTQINRLMNRNDLSKEEALNRINSQMKLREKVKYANKVIDNNGDLHSLEKQVEDILNNVMEV